MKYKLLLAYDGTQYGGWQVQNNSTAIQALLENALATILRAPIAITGAGRTDAGVHALGQVAHFTYEQPLDLFRTQGSLNGLLPPDIRVLEVQTASDDFHARYSAKSKIYHYHLHLDSVMSPFHRLYRHHVHFSIDLEELRTATKLFIGTHDFSAFANEASAGAAAKNPIRTITRLDVAPQEGGLRLEFEGDSFLYKMVRNITGTLLDVCRGKISREQIPEIFASKDRRLAGSAAPPQGLFLVKINYIE